MCLSSKDKEIQSILLRVIDGEFDQNPTVPRDNRWPRYINKYELRKMRKEKGWTQKELGQALGIPQAYISDDENGFWLTQKAYVRIANWMGERNTWPPIERNE